jgi:hypothetical protein
MMDIRNGETHQLAWWQWKQFCKEQGVDPCEESEIGFDLGLIIAALFCLVFWVVVIIVAF